MENVTDYINTLQKLYGSALLALIVFGVLFVIAKGRAVLKRPSEGTINEAAHNLLLVLFNAAIGALVFGNLSFLSNLLFEQLSMPHVTASFWESVPKPFIFILALLALDFQNYWSHRILHTKYFWGIHALHHSDEHMTWTTGYRIHIFEWVIMSFVYVTLVGWLFLPPEIVAVVGVMRIWHSKLIHCQLGWTFGPFRKIFASPNYHRWHHSILEEAYDKNLSDMFPIWDILFGTHYDPGPCETKLGVEGMKVYPFKYALTAIKKRLPQRKVPGQTSVSHTP